MSNDKLKNLTLIDCTPAEQVLETISTVETVEATYQSNPLKADLYSKLAAFRNSQRKFGIKDAIKDSLK